MRLHLPCFFLGFFSRCIWSLQTSTFWNNIFYAAAVPEVFRHNFSEIIVRMVFCNHFGRDDIFVRNDNLTKSELSFGKGMKTVTFSFQSLAVQ